MKKLTELQLGDPVIVIEADGTPWASTVRQRFTAIDNSIDVGSIGAGAYTHQMLFNVETGQAKHHPGMTVIAASEEMIQAVRAEETARRALKDAHERYTQAVTDRKNTSLVELADEWYRTLTPEQQEFVRSLAGRFAPIAEG